MPATRPFVGSESGVVVVKSGVQHVVLQREDLPSEAAKSSPAFLPSPAFFCSSPSWRQPVSAVLNLCSEHGSFILARAGAHVWSDKLACVLRVVMRLLGSMITPHDPHLPEPRASCPHTSMSHISAHPTPWSMLCITCHHFDKQTGHLFCLPRL